MDATRWETPRVASPYPPPCWVLLWAPEPSGTNGGGTTVVSDRGGKYGYVVRSRQDVYRALRKHGMSKSKAAAISNEGRTRAGRSAMSKKAARTRAKRHR